MGFCCTFRPRARATASGSWRAPARPNSGARRRRASLDDPRLRETDGASRFPLEAMMGRRCSASSTVTAPTPARWLRRSSCKARRPGHPTAKRSPLEPWVDGMPRPVQRSPSWPPTRSPSCREHSRGPGVVTERAHHRPVFRSGCRDHIPGQGGQRRRAPAYRCLKLTLTRGARHVAFLPDRSVARRDASGAAPQESMGESISKRAPSSQLTKLRVRGSRSRTSISPRMGVKS